MLMQYETNCIVLRASKLASNYKMKTSSPSQGFSISRNPQTSTTYDESRIREVRLIIDCNN